MARRVKLPVMDEEAIPTATASALRERLGGRLVAATDPIVGELVVVEGRGGEPAVALFADEAHVHVLVGEGIVRRVPRDDVRPETATPAPLLTKLVADVRSFASLAEGDRVEFLSPAGDVSDGTIAEKCRYGALVLRADGSAVAVGFRRLWRSRRPLN